MAGIGFKLRRLFEQDSYTDMLRGIVYSSTLAGGPIFFSILILALIGIYSRAFLSDTEVNILFVTIIYIFAFSLIITGISQLLITRYLSDLIYEHRTDQILPTFTSVLILTIIAQLLVALPFCLFWEIDFLYKASALALFVTVGCIWQLMIFLSAVKNYRLILAAFVTGLGVSLGLSILLGYRAGLPGFLHGYTIGQIVLLFILLSRILIEFKSTEKPDFAFLQHAKRMPDLIIIGLFYNLGIWVDKIIFWFSPHGEHVDAFLFAFSSYDTANFYAFLSVIPSFTYFLVKIETEYYGFVRAFFSTILDKKPLADISKQRRYIAESVRESLIGLVKLQGTVTLICLLFSKEIADFFHIPKMGTLIFEKALLAVFLQMLLLTVMIFLHYFDIKKEVLYTTLIFVCANAILTIITIPFGYVYFGYGYLFACLIAVIAGYTFLNRHMNQLEYHTFVSQPMF